MQVVGAIPGATMESARLALIETTVTEVIMPHG